MQGRALRFITCWFFAECEIILVPGVTLLFRLFRSANSTMFWMKRTDIKRRVLDDKVQSVNEKASQFIRKMVVTDSVKTSFGQNFSNCAIYPFFESLNTKFIFRAGKNCFIKINVFGTESIHTLTLCVVKSTLFRSTPLNHLPFSYKKLGVRRFQ